MLAATCTMLALGRVSVSAEQRTATPGGVEWPSAAVHETANAVPLGRRRLLPVSRRVRVAVLVRMAVAVTAALVVHVILPTAVLMPVLSHFGPLRVASPVSLLPVTVRVAVRVIMAVRMLMAVAIMASSGAVTVITTSLVRRRRGLLRGARCCHGAAVLPLDVEVSDQGAGAAAEDLCQVHAALLARDHLHDTCRA